MNVRSITIVVAVLVLSTVAGFAQAWTKGSQGSTTWTIPNSQTQTPPPAQPQTPPPAQPQKPAPVQPPRPAPAQPQIRQNQPENSDSLLTQGLYAGFNFGGAYQQNSTVETTTGPSGGPSTTTSQDTTFNLGARGDVALGYHVSESWAAEFNTGLIWNSTDNGQAYPNNVGIDTYTVPILVNAIYRIPFKGPWSSYLGVGGGGAVSILSYSASAYNNLGNYNFVFAYQAKAGLEYRLTDNASIDLAYEFFGTTDPSWSFSQTVGANTTDYTVKEKGFFTHSVVISFTWTF